ncbi:MAG: hypothetical protein ACRDIX_00625 [Actinomycetota bacterium]
MKPLIARHRETELAVPTRARAVRRRATEPGEPCRPDGPHSATSLLALQRSAGNRAVAGALGRGRGLDHRASRDFSPLPAEEEETTRSRDRTSQADPGIRAQGGGGGAPAAAPPAAAPPVPATPRFPARWRIRHDDTVRDSINVDWRASRRDYGERFAWVMWNSDTGAFSLTGRATGTWLQISIPGRPSDAPPLYHVGEYHIHPPLPPAQRRNTHQYPVGPSGTDRSGATGADNPGVVKDFTTTRRRQTTYYYYGPYRRRGAVH